MLLEWLLITAALALALWLLRVEGQYASVVAGGLVALVVLNGAVGLAARRPPALPEPVAPRGEGFTTSAACRSCHPAQYASWHASFHRRMTQRPALDAVASPPLAQGGRLRVDAAGRTVELFGRAGSLWARLPDPGVTAAAAPERYAAAFQAAPARDVPVQLLTGSHQHQAFWVAGAREGELVAVPAVYVIDEGRLIPRRDAFLTPPDAAEHLVRWSSNCVQCHTVAGAPGHDGASDTFSPRAAELGIACEACHAQGAGHVHAMQSPLARYQAAGRPARELAIVNPAELSSARASEVCGRCHSYFYPRNEDDWWQNGFAHSFTPGQELSRAQILITPQAWESSDAPQVAADIESLFYQDGTIRVGGREYNGLVRSPCFERGRGREQLSCLSCHSLHRGAPEDQLDPEKLGNRACTQCHRSLSEDAPLSAHTHHSASGSGSLCYNCHMPHISYALLGAIRSHRVTSPAFDASTRDKPNACSLCHLEQSEGWAAKQARAWFGPRSAFGEATDPRLARPEPAGAVFALQGDAAVRAVTAAALGRVESSAISLALRHQLLGELSRDDYAAVRAVAEKARRRLPRAGTAAPPLDPARIEELLAARDQRPLTIAE